MRSIAHTLGLALALLALSSCTTVHGLKVSEVGVGVVELYLDEPPANELQLSDHVLTIKTLVPDPHDPTQTIPWESRFELWGSLHGGEYLVLWEEPGHTGIPAYGLYDNFDHQSVVAIAVAPGTLAPPGMVDNTKPFSYRLYAHRYRYIFPFFYAFDDNDDVVTFGPRPRPDVGGTFTETGRNDAVMRSVAVTVTPGETVWRRTHQVGGVDVPMDNDSEDDFRQDNESFGKAK